MFETTTEFRLWIGSQDFANRLILSAKMKKVEKSASKNKHPIKLRFLIWKLQSSNPEKKVIPENQEFGSCPLKNLDKIKEN